MRRSIFSLFVMCALGFQAHAAIIEQPLADSVKEQQARAIFHELRCMVCEGQSLAESDATLAVQMRAHIREMLQEGTPPAEVVAYFRSSYGERILMTPPFEIKTVLLWLLPFLFLLGGGIAVWRLTRANEES